MTDNRDSTPLGDSARLTALSHAFRSDSTAHATFDRLALLAARTLRAPVAQVNFVTEDRQVSVSSVGPEPWAGPREVPLDLSYCQHVVTSGEPLLVEDAREHPLVRDSPATSHSGIVSYAAVPLTVGDDLVLGTLCVVDFTPREWSGEEVELLESLAEFVIAEIQRRGHSEAELLHLTAVLESVEDAIVGIDLDGTITSWNPGAERMFGYASGEICGRAVSTLAPPECREEVAALARRVQRGETVPRFETERMRRDGSRVSVSVVVTPVRDIAGRLVGATGVLRDITSRIEAEEALRQSQARFRSLVENVGEIITILDADGTIRYESPAAYAVLGYAPEERVGKSIFQLVHPDDAPGIQESLAEALRSAGKHVRYAARFRHQDGSWRVLEGIGVSLLHDPAVAGIVANSRDVTERVRLEEQLHQAQKMEAVGRLAGGIAHDFNNLLMAIKASAEFLLVDLPAEHPSREDAREVKSAAERAAILTQQLLAFSRKQVLQPRVLDLNEVVRETESMLRRLIGEDVEFVTRLAPDLGRVEADPGQLGQVLVNLAINARDAMPNGGKLILETQNVRFGEQVENVSPFLPAGTPGVLLAVSDTGEGMPKEVQERIFEPFFTTKEVGKGTGLGLSTVYGIVKQTGGYVWVYSEVGRGTTFKIYLPQTGAAPEVRESGPVPREEERSGTILLVEDDAVVRNATRRILERSGYRVHTTGEAEEALRLAGDHGAGIDLLITDVVMPSMNGRELSERLQTVRPGTKVLFMSGYTDEAIVQHGVLDPGINFLQKPFGIEELARKVREVLEGPGRGESEGPASGEGAG